MAQIPTRGESSQPGVSAAAVRAKAQNAAAKEQRAEKGRSLWYDSWLRLRRNRLAMLGLFLVLFITFLAVFAPWIAPYDPFEQRIWVDETSQLAPPSAKYWFGTDIYGRDILSRVIWGARISLSIAALATVVSVVIGITLGSLAGYYGGRIDDLVTWLINVVYSFPFLLLVLAIVAFLQDPDLTLLYVVLGIVSWPTTARLVRGQFLSVKETEFVEAARAVGAGDLKIIFQHILPNTLAPVIVNATLNMGGVIMTEAGLSFLGFGTQPPMPSWGLMVSRGQEYLLAGQWWWSVFPGLAIMVTVLGFNLLGDGLRDAMDPRLKQ